MRSVRHTRKARWSCKVSAYLWRRLPAADGAPIPRGSITRDVQGRPGGPAASRPGLATGRVGGEAPVHGLQGSIVGVA